MSIFNCLIYIIFKHSFCFSFLNKHVVYCIIQKTSFLQKTNELMFIIFYNKQYFFICVKFQTNCFFYFLREISECFV